MHPRFFRLLEALQQIDEALRRAQRRADGPEIDRLAGLKTRAKYLAYRFLGAPAFMPAGGRA